MPRSGTSLMAHKSPTRSCSWSSWISPRPAVSLTENTCDVLSDPGFEPARLSRRMMDVRQSRRRFCLQTWRTRALLNMSGPDGFHRCGLGALAHDASGSLALPSFVPNCDEGGDEPSAPMINMGPSSSKASLRPLPETIWRPPVASLPWCR